MAKPEIPKRELKFDDLQAVLIETKRLQQQGYDSRGNWTLGQTCGHLAEWLRYPMDGFPKAPLLVRAILWTMKVTVAKSWAKKVLNEGFKGGAPTAPDSVPEADELSDVEGIAKLEQVIERAEKYDGELMPSPLFGKMDRELWIKVTLLHSEHHLGYLTGKV